MSHAAEAGQGAVIEGEFVTVSPESVDGDTGEITQHAGARPGLPAMTDEQFGKNLPSWRAMIESGQKTADEIIAMVSSRSVLSEEQIAMLRASATPS